MLALLSFVCVLVLIEAGARFAISGNELSRIQPNPVYNKLLKEKYFSTHPKLGFIPGPTKMVEGTRQGYQNGWEYDGKKETSNTKKIAIIGPSTISYGFLKNSFKAIFNNDDYQIWNFGISGYNVIQKATYIESMTSLNPDLFIVFLSPLEFTTSMGIQKNESNGEYNFVKYAYEPLLVKYPKLFKYSGIYRAYVLWFQKNIPTEGIGIEALHNNKFIYQAGIKKFKELAEKRGAELLLVFYPQLMDLNMSEPEAYDTYLILALREGIKIAKALNVDYLDMYPTLKKHGIEKLRLNKDDVESLSKRGNFIVAKKILNKIHEQLGISKKQMQSYSKMNFEKAMR